MLDSAELRIVMLAEYGFFARAIQSRVKRIDKTTYSLSSIYAACKRHGVRMRDYRDGSSDIAKETMAGVDKKLK